MIQWEQPLVGKRILVTGHSGFTGGWTCLWLHEIGAEVCGVSLPPDTEPSLYQAAGVGDLVMGRYLDIRHSDELGRAFAEFRPELVVHLAAQPLVRRSYAEPIGTFETNVMGTLNVLNAASGDKDVHGVLCITTDKVYENKETGAAFHESDRLGGADPYSASKAAAEIAISSWRKSFAERDGRPPIAVARGGNIIGGGDWSDDRLVPDFVRAIVGDQPLRIRFPEAVRPWQHVLGLVQGYLMLLSRLLVEPDIFARPFNFGPREDEHLSVREMIERLAQHWRSPHIEFGELDLPESGMLRIDSRAAVDLLGWSPVWGIEESLRRTAQWYRNYYQEPGAARDMTLGQIRDWRDSLHTGVVSD